MTTTAPVPILHELEGSGAPPPLEQLLPGIEVYNWNRGPNIVEASVPMSLIEDEDVPVDEAHVAELVDQLEKERETRGTRGGQITNVELGLVAGGNRLLTIDGFHRKAAFGKLSREMVFATLQVNMDMDAVWDRRIQTARQSTVMFARLPEWINESWKLTPFSDQLSVVQAFKIARDGTARSIDGIDELTIHAAAAWARAKTKAWGKGLTVNRLHTDLMTSAEADPELRRQVREKGAFSKEHLRVIAKELPLDFKVQQLVAKIVLTGGLDVARTRLVAREFAQTDYVHEAEALAISRDWRLVTLPAKKVVTAGSATKGLVSNGVVEPARSTMSTTENTVGNTTLPRQLLLAELKLGRTSLTEFVVLNDAYQPSLGAPEGEISFNVVVGSDPDFVQLTAPLQHAVVVARLESMVEQVTPNFKQALLARRIEPERADTAIAAAKKRIARDMESGDLRYVDVMKSREFAQRLFIKTVNDELKRSVAPQPRPPMFPYNKSIGSLSLGKVIEATANLSDNERSILVYKGLLDVSSIAVARLMGSNLSTVVDQTWSVFKAIKSDP